MYAYAIALYNTVTNKMAQSVMTHANSFVEAQHKTSRVCAEGLEVITPQDVYYASIDLFESKKSDVLIKTFTDDYKVIAENFLDAENLETFYFAHYDKDINIVYRSTQLAPSFVIALKRAKLILRGYEVVAIATHDHVLTEEQKDLLRVVG